LLDVVIIYSVVIAQTCILWSRCDR